MSKDTNMTAKMRKVKAYDIAAFIRMDGNEKSADYVEGRRVYNPAIGSTPYKCTRERLKAVVWYVDGSRFVCSSQKASHLIRNDESVVKAYFGGSKRYVYR